MLDIFIEPALADDIKERRGNTIPGVTGPNPADLTEGSNPTSIPASYEPQALSDVESVDPHSYVGQVVGGKYRLDKKIGQGGMGEVYLGLNDELGQKVAVKFLSRKFADDEGIVQRFLNEARSYCRVNHPNAVTLLEYGQHDDTTLYIITEFVEGLNLAQHMKAKGFLAFSQIVSLASQLCEVLSSAHEQGVIHRDLKPDNLMLSPTSRGRYTLKVLDFGIAKIMDEDHDGPNTETGSVFGTPEFMSPEQARGEAADPRSDIYAVGIILFFMLTGKLPFKGKNKLVVLNQQLNKRPPRPTEIRPDGEIPLKLEAIVMKCLNKGRDERYASADDLLDALEELHIRNEARTGKVGLSPGLRENSDVAHATPKDSIRHSTVRLEAEASPDLDVLADTLASTEISRSTVSAELESVEMWREQPTTENPTRGRGGSNHFSAVVAGAIIVVLGGVMLFTLFGREGAVETEPDIQGILATGQVVGLLSATEEMVQEGSLKAAHRAIDQTAEWMADDELPDTIREQREDLRLRLSRLAVIEDDFRVAVAAGKCGMAGHAAAQAERISRGVHKRLMRKMRKCEVAPSSTPTPSKELEPSLAQDGVDAPTPAKVVSPAKIVAPPQVVSPKDRPPKKTAVKSRAQVPEKKAEPDPVDADAASLPPKQL